MQKNTLKRKFFVVVLVALIVMICYAVYNIRLTDIVVKGNKIYDEDVIVHLIFPEKSDNITLLAYYKNKKETNKKKIPFIDSYDIQIDGMNSATITVREKSIVGYVEFADTFMFFDEDGVVVEAGEQQIAGIPKIEGLQFQHMLLYEKLPIENQELFRVILNITQLLDQFDMDVDTLYFMKNKNLRIVVNEIVVELGSYDYIEEKLIEMNSILPQLFGKKGTLNIADCVPGENGAGYIFVEE